MKAQINAWGKLDALGRKHPLTAHMLDVAACFDTLVELTTVRRALQRVAGRPLTQQDLARLSALAFLHDVGKANAGFQAKQWSREGQSVPAGWPPMAGHTNEALFIFVDDNLAGVLPLEAMNEWGPACLSLWRASISHHGRPVEDPADSSVMHLWKPVVRGGAVVYDPRATLADIGQCLRNWFAPAFEAASPLPNQAEFAHLFAGLVQFADWLGSDTTFFPYAEPGEDRNQTAWQRAKDAVGQIGVDVDAWRRALPTLPDFAKVFAVEKPRPVQAKMAEAGLGSLLILESETGSGKTEAALWRFAQLFQTGQVDSLYFALPTRVAATQLYSRTLQFAKNLWAKSPQGPPLVVRALTGYESADGQDILQKLPDFKFLWADNPDDQKPTLAGPQSRANAF